MKLTKILTAALVSVALTACGGGSGSSTSTAASANPPAPVPVTPPVLTVTPADIQTSVAVSTYAAGSQELAFFTILNDFRSKLGLGLLAQNPQLDVANNNHLKYLIANKDVDFSAVDPKTGRPFFHVEDAAQPNFTGVTELDRASNWLQTRPS